MRHLATRPTRPAHPEPDAHDPDRVAFEIGWDYAQHRLVPPADHLHEGNPVRDGWQAGHEVFGVRTLLADAAVRKWLQLRLNAWMRGKAFDRRAVTPQYLRLIDVGTCPITDEALTHATGEPGDASVDRVNNDAGYAAGNLCVMSRRANRAKSAYDWRDCAGFARQVEVGDLGHIDGLDARAWSRLAALASYCTPLSHAEAASMPMLVLPPPGLHLLNPAQALQALVSREFARPGRTPRIDRLLAAFPAGVTSAARALCHTLLARRLAAPGTPDAETLRRVVESAWAEPSVLAQWRRVSLPLGIAGCRFIVQRASHAPAIDPSTDGWSLETAGRVPAWVARPRAAAVPLAPMGIAIAPSASGASASVGA